MIFPILNKIGFKFRQNIIWRFKGGLSAKHKLSGRYEDIMWIYKGNDKPTFNLDNIRLKEWTRFDKRNNPLGKNPSNVWDIKRVAYGSKEKTEHPCQFPENMIERIVLGFSNKEDLILDLFGGSFTTAKVCEKLRRKNIGIELSKKYCDIGIDRLSKLQMRLDI
jgi:adenine-specific DNA-methyltransferase